MFYIFQPTSTVTGSGNSQFIGTLNYAKGKRQRKLIQNVRVKSVAKVQKFSVKKQHKIVERRQRRRFHYAAADTPEDMGSFESEEELAEAVAKLERTLPKSPSKRKAVIAALFHSLDEESQREIIQSIGAKKRIVRQRIAPALLQKIQIFYARDDVSRTCADNGFMAFVNPATGEWEFEDKRNLMYTLKEAYALFISENQGW